MNIKRIPYSDEKAKDFVNRFCGHFFWLKRIHHAYRTLFEDEGSVALMDKTARSFFGMLQTVLSEYVLLEFSKIMDPARSNGKENFTVDNLIISIDWPQGIREKLTGLGQRTKDFRKYTMDARNKLLAHTDKDTFLAEETLGKFPQGADEAFLKTLQEICDITHEVCCGSIIGTMSVVAPGDVISFKKALLNAVAFKEYESESSGQELARLYSYLDKAKRRNESNGADRS